MRYKYTVSRIIYVGTSGPSKTGYYLINCQHLVTTCVHSDIEPLRGTKVLCDQKKFFSYHINGWELTVEIYLNIYTSSVHMLVDKLLLNGSTDFDEIF